MTKLTRWLDQHTDPTGVEHPATDADDALRLLVEVCLVLIATAVVIGIVLWCTTRPTSEVAPASGTTTTEQP